MRAGWAKKGQFNCYCSRRCSRRCSRWRRCGLWFCSFVLNCEPVCLSSFSLGHPNRHTKQMCKQIQKRKNICGEWRYFSQNMGSPHISLVLHQIFISSPAFCILWCSILSTPASQFSHGGALTQVMASSWKNSVRRFKKSASPWLQAGIVTSIRILIQPIFWLETLKRDNCPHQSSWQKQSLTTYHTFLYDAFAHPFFTVFTWCQQSMVSGTTSGIYVAKTSTLSSTEWYHIQCFGTCILPCKERGDTPHWGKFSHWVSVPPSSNPTMRIPLYSDIWEATVASVLYPLPRQLLYPVYRSG